MMPPVPRETILAPKACVSPTSAWTLTWMLASSSAVSPHSRVVQLPPSYSAARRQRRLAAKAKPSMPEPSNAKLAGSGTAPTTLGFFYRLRQLEGRTRQQLPAAVLLQPDLQDADLG